MFARGLASGIRTRAAASSARRRFAVPAEKDKSKTQQLRDMLYRDDMAFLMEAHNGLSARIVQEAGFEGIWASGLSMSAALGVRDNNEASWTQILETVEFMADNTTIPILLDGDTGFGNFNNARRLIKKLQQRGIAGVCMEDKIFPKTNSFIAGSTQKLAAVSEFCGKIEACKDVAEKTDPNFIVVARCESLITGLGLEDCLSRAEAYADAGADAILCHSKLHDPSEIEAFMTNWDNRCPVIIVPTMYWKTPTEVFEELDVSTCIWANHNVRASVTAMQNASKAIFESRSLHPVEDENPVATVKEIFRLQDADGLKDLEKRYDPKPGAEARDAKPIDPKVFVDMLKAEGTDFFTGVPDSLLKSLCFYIDDNFEKEHVITANEGAAVGMAIGHYLATGKFAMVYMQNSGLGNCVNPLISMADQEIYSIPMLLMVGWRGNPMDQKKDEPQHYAQGQSTCDMLHSLRIPFRVLTSKMTQEEFKTAVNEAYSHMRTKKSPFAFVVASSAIAPYERNSVMPYCDTDMSRETAIQTIADKFEGCPIISSTGFPSRELLDYRAACEKSTETDFYTIGAMGHCGAIAQGFALATSKKGDVLCLDGDGAVLMHMGTLATAGLTAGSNFKHIVLNNGVHGSVGGQTTGMLDVNIPAVAQSLNYKSVDSCASLAELPAKLQELRAAEGPAFLEIRVTGHARKDLGRPKETPKHMKDLFMQFAQSE